MAMFAAVTATAAERREGRPGDALIARADVVMDRAFTVPGEPATVWPWLVQLGKARAGWYLPARLERRLPAGRRAQRHVDARWQGLRVGDVIPDYGGRDETFTVAETAPPTTLVYRSRRGRMDVTWSIVLRADPSSPAAETPPYTRVLLRLRLGRVRRRWLARTAGELIDVLTIAGMAAGLRERLGGTTRPNPRPRRRRS
jgi:hypothetical protein